MISSRWVAFRHICRITQISPPSTLSRTLTVEAAPQIKPTTDVKLVPPLPEGVEDPKLLAIVNDISALNLLEVSKLSELLKKKLNLPDTAFAPVAVAGPGAGRTDDDEEAAPKKVQTAFKVKLMKFDDKQKVALIKEIKGLIEGMNLVQAKKFVESAPTIVKEDISKEEADKLKEALVKVGATIEIE